MDDAGPGSGDIGGPNEPGSMGCKDPEACNYCEDCVYNCPPNNEYCYWNDFGGNIHIEYLYLFKNGEWLVSEMSSHKNFDHEKYVNKNL